MKATKDDVVGAVRNMVKQDALSTTEDEVTVDRLDLQIMIQYINALTAALRIPVHWNVEVTELVWKHIQKKGVRGTREEFNNTLNDRYNSVLQLVEDKDKFDMFH